MGRNQGHAEIHYNGSEFFTKSVAENGESLQHAETFKKKETAVSNIVSMLNLYGGASVIVWDFSWYQSNPDNEPTASLHDRFILYADGFSEGYKKGVYKAPKRKYTKRKKNELGS